MIDIRNKFDEVLGKYGNYVLLVRSGSNIRCSCWNDKTKEASKSCKFCYGKGFTVRVERHSSRSIIVSIPETLSRASKLQPYGIVAIPSRAYYFKHDVRPMAGDLIIECRFSGNGVPDISDYTVYEINSIDHLTGLNGRVEYIKAFCGYDPVEKKIITINIRNTDIGINYDLGLRG